MKATKKIVGAACALVAAVALSAGSTFAWFTSNNQVTVGEVEATVVTKGGDLQISLVTINESATPPASKYSFDGWTNTLKSADIMQKITDEGAKTLLLDHVSSADGKTFTNVAGGAQNRQMTTGQYAWVEFTIALRSTTPMDIYLNNSSLTSQAASPAVNPVKCWGDVAANTYGKNQSTAWTADSPITAKAQCASRVSFDIVAGADAKTIVWAPWETTENGGNDYSEEQISDDDFTDRDNYGYYVTGDTSEGENHVAGKNLAGDVAFFGGKEKIYWGATTEYDNRVSPVPTGKTVVRADAGVDQIEATEAGKYNVVTLPNDGSAVVITIRMWIEGKDGDCLNSIFGQKITMGLGFYGLDPAPAGA